MASVRAFLAARSRLVIGRAVVSFTRPSSTAQDATQGRELFCTSCRVRHGTSFWHRVRPECRILAHQTNKQSRAALLAEPPCVDFKRANLISKPHQTSRHRVISAPLCVTPARPHFQSYDPRCENPLGWPFRSFGPMRKTPLRARLGPALPARLKS